MNYNLQANPTDSGKLIMYDPDGLELFEVKVGIILDSYCFLVLLDSGITPISLSSNRALMKVNDMKALLPSALGEKVEIVGEGHIRLDTRSNLKVLSIGDNAILDFSTVKYPGSYPVSIKLDNIHYEYYCSGYHPDLRYAPLVKMGIGAIAETL